MIVLFSLTTKLSASIATKSFFNCRRFISGTTMKGLVLGAYHIKDKNFDLSPSAKKFDKNISGRLQHFLDFVSPNLSTGDVRVFYDLAPGYYAVALSALPKKESALDETEGLYSDLENVRIAVSNGCRILQQQGVKHIYVEDFGEPESAAEGAVLGTWKFQEFKNPDKIVPVPTISPFEVTDRKQWDIGYLKGEAQNIARRLTDLPANILTPNHFATVVMDLFKGLDVDIKSHSTDWIREQKMNSFLSVSNGSSLPPVFLEMVYNPNKIDKPIVFVGKGITFDSGGISLKASADMDEMRGDMGGAACIVAAMFAICKLGLPLSVTALIPLCENMPGGSATHPGDVVKARNGKTIQIDNTDAEGRLILADALSYAAEYSPSCTIDIATLTGAIGTAIGDAATGVFTNSSSLFNKMNEAGQHTGDRVWRFPLYKTYSKLVTDYASVDVNNLGKTKEAGACRAAAFLKEFAPAGDWMHMDIAGVMGTDDKTTSYLHKGMTGRPTRTLIQFLMQHHQQ